MSRYNQLRFQENTLTAHGQPNPTIYVLGFAFDLTAMTSPRVCLILKNKPDWQAGCLNGVGGKVEAQDLLTEITPYRRQIRRAMEREFLEETGVLIGEDVWHHFHTMRFQNGAIVHCFTARLMPDDRPITMESEIVDMYGVGHMGRWQSRNPAVPNLNWLIPMAFHELCVPAQERMLTE